MSRSKVALVTGFTGQDGTFLTRQLLDKGYTVLGLCRRISTEPPRRARFDFSKDIAEGRLHIVEGDLLSQSSLNQVILDWQPQEIYNLAAQSHVGLSFAQPEYTIASILQGTMNLITALEHCHMANDWRMYQASTSEMFGDIAPESQPEWLTERYPLNPNSPYAIAKAAAHYYCKMKRAQGFFISCGILFNHESEIRGGDFVTQKIANGVINWIHTDQPIFLGNMEAIRDWGYSGDYVDAMWRMLQTNHPDDYVVATGVGHTVKDFCNSAFKAAGLSLKWTLDEDGFDRGQIDGHDAIRVSKDFYRPNDVGFLIGDPGRAKRKLDWQPSTSFDQLVQIMVQAAQKRYQ